LAGLEWVLDTWLLEIAQNPLDEGSLDAVFLLRELKLRHRIALDHEHTIQGEYFRHLKPGSHAAQWFSAMLRRAEKTVWRNGSLSERRKSYLIDRLRFDRADLVFVAVSAEEPDKLLVSEESDYNPEVKRYLLGECGVRVLSIEEAVDLAGQG
jgi:hypothetical protein